MPVISRVGSLVRTSAATNAVEDRYDANHADEERLTCAFVILSLTPAVLADISATHLPVPISAQIRPP
jgi:hypothetical protein